MRKGRAITAEVPDYRLLDFEPLPPRAAAALPNGVVAPGPADRVLAGEDAAGQVALAAQVARLHLHHALQLAGAPESAGCYLKSEQ